MFLEPYDPPRHTDEECSRLLNRFLLPPAALLAILAPGGWANSPLRRCFHPTPEQRRTEAIECRENLKRSRAALERRQPAEDGTDDNPVAAGDEEAYVGADDAEPVRDPQPIEPDREVVALVGCVLWDVFSNNHAVFDERGKFDLGSFRASASFLAEEINVRYRQAGGRRAYLDFYMGTLWLARRADLRPVYRWVFAGLRAAGCDWRYSFPRIYLVSFEHERERADEGSCDPSAAVTVELEAAQREYERAELQERLDAAHNEAVEEAKRRPRPAIVQAYDDVVGRWPEGWPPSNSGA
jgi:hypothetical protein